MNDIITLNGTWGYTQNYLTFQFAFLVVLTIFVEFGILSIYILYKSDKKVYELSWLPIFLCVLVGNIITALIGWFLLGV